jgi:hypothetical protein
MVGPVLPLHLGALHPHEQVLVYVLAFGPFLLLALVVVLRRRGDLREEAREAEGPAAGATDQRER